MGAAEGSQDWISAALDVLAAGGIDGVRVEVVAQRLGVTKGGFYRRYRDRRALLDAMLETWVAGRIDAIHRQTELGGRIQQGRILVAVEEIPDVPPGIARAQVRLSTTVGHRRPHS